MNFDHGNQMHGDSVSRNGKPALLYLAWKSMKDRCYNPNFRGFSRYGGRGIAMCSQWEKDYPCFKSWAIDNGFQEGLTIDRIHNDKGYYPGNCQWLPMEINLAKRNVPARKLTMEQAEQIRASEMTATQLGKQFSVSRGVIWRIKNGRVYVKKYEGIFN